MKKNIYIATIGYVLMASACTNLLEVESKTSITNDYLTTTIDGLERYTEGLYNKDREFAITSNSSRYAVEMFDFNTDISIYRAGTATAIARLDNLTPTNSDVESHWEHHYAIIGKANEIIVAAEQMGLDNPRVKQAWGEAKVFRARAYFMLYKRFERLYLNIEPTNVNNLDREFKPATKENIFNLIKNDLDNAIDVLDWTTTINGVVESGRMNKAVAKHIRAQVAMWEEDWDTAIEQCEDIFTEGNAYYHMLGSTDEVFSSENLRNAEIIWSYQFSKNKGGGGTVDGNGVLSGHKASLIVTTRYHAVSGCTFSSEYGGYAWGRIYPNTYLFSLYDQQKDTRYKKLFIHDFYFNDPNQPETYGQLIDKNFYNGAAGYLERLHPMSIKHADFWTNQDQPDRTSSFRDLIVYRLAETYLMCAEAYVHKDGGSTSNANAIAYYNQTWERAGNDHESGPLTLQMLLDEYARELHFEGVRWSLLKRLGLLATEVKKHSGDTKQQDPYLDRDYIECRTNFVAGKHETWPIPSNQILLMGEQNFPQSDPWK